MVAGQMASTPLLALKSASVWMASSLPSQKSLPHGTVEVDIHEARQGIEALCVQNFFAFAPPRMGQQRAFLDNAALPDNDAPPPFTEIKRVAGQCRPEHFE